ncbi:transcriptional regulator, AraC family [Chryseobacterium oleae]|uniref:Transcriptional regulator, AraC family n=1 Tax=Chryseobacterium oleae TaxID=491207 RepID=A0A1I4YS33_CHROL|nr:helix-turn-helix transcriptional regulator [Chryseobacterium oleae]SFN40858.1 transcriptional regulator, AraC family [Chryseobacterium oleae]
MKSITNYSFKPISNKDQNMHIISISERIKRGAEAVFRPHRTDFYIIQYITQGEGTYFVDFEEIKFKANDVWIVSPNQVHHFVPDVNYEGILIAFTETFYARSAYNKSFLSNAHIFNPLGGTTFFELKEHEGTIFQEIIASLIVELNHEFDTVQASILHNGLSNILNYAERSLIKSNNYKNKLSGKDSSYTMAFKKLVRQNFTEYKTVKDYADKLHISDRKLQKAIEATLGKSPKSYITDHIILESKRLLTHEDLSIKEISFALGFDEPTNFTKFFKKQTEASPSDFKLEQKKK